MSSIYSLSVHQPTSLIKMIYDLQHTYERLDIDKGINLECTYKILINVVELVIMCNLSIKE